jgi:AcrR family transcriptional regulator
MSTPGRPALTRDRVLDGALVLADEMGMERFTIRHLAERLDTKPMSIYHHVPSKDEIVDGMVDRVFGEIELPPEDLDWQGAVRVRCLSARDVLRRHPWAPPLMESRPSPGPAVLRHHDAMLSTLRRGGLSWELTAHGYAIIDSFVYGFALEEANLPGGGGSDMTDLADELADVFAAYPTLAAFTTEWVIRPGYSFGVSFEFGLDLIIDGLARAAGRPERRHR